MLAQAGLMVSEPELAVVAGNGAADSGAGESVGGEGEDEPLDTDGADGAGDHELADRHRDD